ncbi:heme-thiolate peroxidase [Dentipellis fragilis]|uniref:Heme-thiolate peroxidase n=1 Tax=Dentipellis fragilis TaxID=205917 RepID=A0A4Y9ZBW0_9AGAM|nr:heme-thiolate peroxidase [Dentipellis fragilis]
MSASTVVTLLAFGLVSTLLDTLIVGGLLIWDLGLFLYNLVAPARRVGTVVLRGHPGFGGNWPDYIAPKESDSRCACPALNAMANHGIIPRDGRNISFRHVTSQINATYNFAPTFCIFTSRYIAQILGRSFLNDTFDLEDISVHNGIEHDASLTREDTYISTSQARPSLPLVEKLVASATGPPLRGHPSTNGAANDAKPDASLDRTLTLADLARISTKRRADAAKSNSQFSLSTIHKIFGSSNSATLLTIFGGHLPTINTFLTEERLPSGFESFIRKPMGLTMMQFNATVLPLELSTGGEVEREWRTLF